jgi:hypothetical protein
MAAGQCHLAKELMSPFQGFEHFLLLITTVMAPRWG